MVACLMIGGCSKKRTIGKQCPSPASGQATVEGDNADFASAYGTSCAPCNGGDVRLDDDGCPIFVTFESCGGDICIGRALIREPVADGGLLDGDAAAGDAAAGDAGMDAAAEEDGGA